VPASVDLKQFGVGNHRRQPAAVLIATMLSSRLWKMAAGCPISAGAKSHGGKGLRVPPHLKTNGVRCTLACASVLFLQDSAWSPWVHHL
jgi:hypothetical protein